MAESSSFSSLLALVDNHLSQTSVQDNHSIEGTLGKCPGIQIPPLKTLRTTTQSDSWLTDAPRLPIPSFSLSESPIKNVLAEQVANMLKAKEKRKKEEEERQKLDDGMKSMKLDDHSVDNNVIDLMQALRTSVVLRPSQPLQEPTISSSSSLESLFEPKFIDCDEISENRNIPSPEPILPCITDMSYMMDMKIPQAKCSSFGKVLISRYKPVAAPYFNEKLKNCISRFDFKTKSPCDLIKEKLRKPPYSNNTDIKL